MFLQHLSGVATVVVVVVVVVAAVVVVAVVVVVHVAARVRMRTAPSALSSLPLASPPALQLLQPLLRCLPLGGCFLTGYSLYQLQ